MKTLGDTLKTAREEKNLILRKVAAEVDIDQSLISKFEKNERRPTKDQLKRIANFYNLSNEKLLISWYSEKIAEELINVENVTEILKIAEEKINYHIAKNNGE